MSMIKFESNKQTQEWRAKCATLEEKLAEVKSESRGRSRSHTFLYKRALTVWKCFEENQATLHGRGKGKLAAAIEKMGRLL